MAYTYAGTPVLSKLQINGQTYWLKDADLRAIVDAFKGAVNYDVDTTFAEASENLATSKAIAAYVSGAVADLEGAMHYRGMYDSLDAIDFEPEAGDIIIVGTKEYVYGGDPATWQELGDEGTHASQAWVTENYVAKATTIAGIDLEDSITVAELQAALELKALAYKDSASGTIATADSIAMDAYTPAGKVEVTLNQVATEMSATGSYTPEGSASASYTPAGSVSIARDDENGVQVSGTVSAPTITVTPKTSSMQHVTDVGAAATWTGAQYTAPELTTGDSTFATAGIVAEVSGEELIFTTADTAKALSSATLSESSVDFGTFDGGKVPTLSAGELVVTGIESAVATAPTFTGDKFGASFSGTDATINSTFSGTQATIEVKGNYNEASVNTATFTGTEETLTGSLVKTDKTVTVQ